MKVDLQQPRFKRDPRPRLRGPYESKGFPLAMTFPYVMGRRWARSHRPDPAARQRGFHCKSHRVSK